MSNRRLSLATQIAYALPALSLTAAATSVYIFITKFYADSIGLNLSVIGAVVLGSRIWDAVIDPTIGSLADRTRSTFGRRRTWLLASMLPFAFSVLALFAPPELSETREGIWFGTATFLFFLFLSTAQIPYEALGAELSGDYNERNRLFAIRQGFFILGTILAAALPGVLSAQLSLGPDPEAQRNLYFYAGVIYATLTIVSMTVLIYVVRERPIESNVPKNASLFAEAKNALRSRPFRILVIAYILSGFGSALPATLIEFYVRYVLNAESSSPFLVLYFLVGLVTLPAWVWLANRYDKKNTWIISLIVNVGAFIGVFFLSTGSQTLYAALVAISGIGFGGVVTIPYSMQADVIEYDARMHGGVRREGTFMGLWSIANKLSAALGAGVAFPILDYVGYVPNAVQTPQTVFVLRTLYAGLPSFCYLLSLFVVLAYPLKRSDFSGGEQKIV